MKALIDKHGVLFLNKGGGSREQYCSVSHTSRDTLRCSYFSCPLFVIKAGTDYPVGVPPNIKLTQVYTISLCHGVTYYNVELDYEFKESLE